MATKTASRRTRKVVEPEPEPTTETKSIRVKPAKWERARVRAEANGSTVSRIAALLVEGYGDGTINLPGSDAH